MISMSVIHSIRCMRKEGASVAAIARELGISEPTVRKYLREVDLSDRPPVKRIKTEYGMSIRRHRQALGLMA